MHALTFGLYMYVNWPVALLLLFPFLLPIGRDEEPHEHHNQDKITGMAEGSSVNAADAFFLISYVIPI